ncbi:MAG: hypothetical protein EPO24_07425 [Bacteroidetes bacterium]|nr:MAG: hypothetical protein EPO24_07425 [Bacteroidota bacterium]
MEKETILIKRGKQSMLILSEDDPEAEDRFEMEFMLSLTPVQRYKMMSKLFRQGQRMLKKNDNKKTPSLFART